MGHRILGLDVSSEWVCATVIDASFRGYEVTAAKIIPVPEPDKASVQEPAKPQLVRDEPEIKADQESFSKEKEASHHSPVTSEQKPPEPWTFVIEDLLSDPDFEHDEVVVAIQSEAASSRMIELPFTQQRRIDQVLNFEIETQVPFALDDRLISYQILSSAPQKANLLVVIVKEEDIAERISQFAKAGVDPKIIDYSGASLVAAAQMSQSISHHPWAVVHFGTSTTEFGLFAGQNPVLVRSLPKGSRNVLDNISKMLKVDRAHARHLLYTSNFNFGDPVEDKAKGNLSKAVREELDSISRLMLQTLHAIKSEQKIFPKYILMSGPLAAISGIKEYFQGKLGIDVRMFLPFSNNIPGKIPISPQVQATGALALGLAMRGTSALRGKRINFRTGKFVFHKSRIQMEGQLRRIAAMAGILLLLTGYNWMTNHSLRKARLEALDAQIAQLFQASFPGEKIVNPMMQFQQNMSQILAKYKIIGYLGEGDVQVLNVLKAISESIPKTVKIDIRRMDISQEAVKFEAETDNFENVDKIEAALSKISIFKSVKKDQATTGANEAIKFRFSISLSEKKETTKTGPAASMGSTGIPGKKPGLIDSLTGGKAQTSVAPPAKPTPGPPPATPTPGISKPTPGAAKPPVPPPAKTPDAKGGKK